MWNSDCNFVWCLIHLNEEKIRESERRREREMRENFVYPWRFRILRHFILIFSHLTIVFALLSALFMCNNSYLLWSFIWLIKWIGILAIFTLSTWKNFREKLSEFSSTSTARCLMKNKRAKSFLEFLLLFSFSWVNFCRNFFHNDAGDDEIYSRVIFSLAVVDVELCVENEIAFWII